MMQSRRTVAAVSDLPHTHQHFNSRLRITHMSACAMATKRRQTANKKYNFDRMQLPATRILQFLACTCLHSCVPSSIFWFCRPCRTALNTSCLAVNVVGRIRCIRLFLLQSFFNVFSLFKYFYKKKAAIYYKKTVAH